MPASMRGRAGGEVAAPAGTAPAGLPSGQQARDGLPGGPEAPPAGPGRPSRRPRTPLPPAQTPLPPAQDAPPAGPDAPPAGPDAPPAGPEGPLSVQHATLGALNVENEQKSRRDSDSAPRVAQNEPISPPAGAIQSPLAPLQALTVAETGAEPPAGANHPHLKVPVARGASGSAQTVITATSEGSAAEGPVAEKPAAEEPGQKSQRQKGHRQKGRLRPSRPALRRPPPPAPSASSAA